MNFKENMMEEQRNLKVSFNKSGGTAGTDMYLVKAGYYITASTKYVEVFER